MVKASNRVRLNPNALAYSKANRLGDSDLSEKSEKKQFYSPTLESPFWAKTLMKTSK